MSGDIDYIKQRLARWGEWNARRESGGLGFPRECSYTRMQARSEVGLTAPEIDQEAVETEHAVAELPEYLRETVRSYYVKPGTVEQKARDLRCGRDTVYARLERAFPLLSDLFGALARKKNRKGA